MAIDGGDGAETAAKAPDLVKERKHAEMTGRLAAMNEVRLQESSIRKSSMASAIDPRESVDAFLSTFGRKKEAVEVGLALARTKQVEPSALKEHFEKFSFEISAMEKSIAGAAYFLPASVVKSSQNAVGKLRDELEIANAELVPKKKFSFRNKVKSSPVRTISPLLSEKTADTVSPEQTHGSIQRSSDTASSGNYVEDNAGSTSSSFSGGGSAARIVSTSQPENYLQAPQAASPVLEINNAERISGQSNKVFVRSAEGMGGELTLSNLNNCKVYLKGRLTTLLLHSLKNCHVYSGPVAGSVFIEDVESSVLVLASHQIRIHSTSLTDFYLRVRSRPIVEYTNKNRFAPYAFHYEGLQGDLEAANLAVETGLWEKVDDFRWLRAMHSPNWRVLPVEERIPVEDGSNVVGAG